MGKMKQYSVKSQAIQRDFLEVLARTGNKAAQSHFVAVLGGLTEDHIVDAMRYAMSSFGQPDQLLMDPESLKAFRKLQK